MNTYTSALNYFRELSRIPRMPLHEEKARNWIIQWADEKGWIHQTDSIGNLLVIAPSNTNTIICLQGHLDMVCVAEGSHNCLQGITLIEDDEKIRAKKTSLGADNGVGVAVMMALAEIEHRPTLELLFTMGEEVGLVGAQNISLPLKASYGLNLDWSDSDTIGIGCGGTLLMQGLQSLESISSEKSNNTTDMFVVKLQGMQGGHSGEDIRHYRGNALIEILKVIKELKGITHIGEITGGEADNAIPHTAQMIVRYNGHPNLLKNELSHLQKILRTKYKYESISLSAEETHKEITLYTREDILPILSPIIEAGTGVQVWGKQNTPLSSWNLGILSLKNLTLSSSYFVRSNLEDGIESMKNDLIAALPETVWTMSHESPPWNNDAQSQFLHDIQAVFIDETDTSLPVMTTHAAVEAGLLSKKYPQTEWISVGVTIADMHTTRESIKTKDFEEFVERMERAMAKIG